MPRRIRPQAWIWTSPILLLALVPFFANRHAASRAGQTFTRDWAVDLLNSVEPYGVLITGGDNDTFPLWYAQEVEGVRRDVTVAVTSLMGTDWYVRDIIRRPVFPYDTANGPPFYRNHVWAVPTTPALHMTIPEADQVPPYYEFGAPQQFAKDSIVATIPAGILTRDQILILRFIKDSYPTRPLYFSSPLIARPIGLLPYLVEQGLAYKLMSHPVHATDSTIVRTPGGFMDVPRTHALWNNYVGTESLIRQGDWIDASSVGIPFSYVAMGYSLADALASTGNVTDSQLVMKTARGMANAAHIEQYFNPR